MNILVMKDVYKFTVTLWIAQEQISAVRKTILETDVNTDQRKAIVHKLIKLKIKEQDLENRRFYQVM